MKRKLLLTFAMLIGVAQMSWCADAIFIHGYNSSTKTAQLRYGDPEAYSGVNAVYDHTNGVWNYTNPVDGLVETLNVEESCQNIPEISMKRLFSGFNKLTTINSLPNLKTALVTDFDYMFAGCSSLTSLDLSGFKTDHAYSMNYMFSGCSNLTTLDLSTFDTEDVTSMNFMFNGCSNLSTITFGTKFKLDYVEYMQGMFYNCSNLSTLDLSSIRAYSVKNMLSMFSGCSSLTALDLSKFDTSNVTSMGSLFNGCTNLATLTLSNFFTTANVTRMGGMFKGCSNLTSIDLSSFDTSNVMYMNNMFNGCSSLTVLDLSNFDTRKVEEIPGIFKGCTNLKAIIVGDDWSTASVLSEEDGDMFTNCTSLVGEDGTTVGSAVDKTYAHTGAGGYLTKRSVEVMTTNTSDGAWATYYKSNVNRRADASTTVYAATRSGSTLNLVEVEDRIIKAGEGVLLKRNAASTSLLVSTTDAATDAFYTDNALEGTDVAMAQLSDNDYFVLSNVDDKLGFYKYKADKTLGANKAFIALVKDPSAPDFFLFGENTTSIAQPNAEKEMQPAEVFDLQGRRIAQPTKGVYIVNGKKIIIK